VPELLRRRRDERVPQLRRDGCDPGAPELGDGAKMSRRFLVVVRAGNASLHPSWLTAGGEGALDRNWDLVVNYFGDDPKRYPSTGDGVVRIDSKGPKWPALAKLMAATRDAWGAYDYVWIPDDDLAASGQDINRMFELAAALDLQLAQPSLSWDSHFSIPLTLHNRAFKVRYSSFVEPMAPLFSRALLQRALPTFSESISGWGLDYVWPRLLADPMRQCAILDRIQVRHTRPVGGPNYAFNRSAGVEPRTEMYELLRRHGIAGPIQLSYGGVDATGRVQSLIDPNDESFIGRLCAGYAEVAGGDPSMVGRIFLDHLRARTELLRGGSAAAG
jgi:hypothetical protein